MKFTTSIILTVLVALPALADDPLFKSPWRAFDVGNDVRPITVDFGDIDGDGDRDALLALEFFGNPGISILRANGDGTFAPEELYRLVDIVGDARLADFDADGDLDAFATIPGNAGTDFRVAVLKNNGDGTFAAAQYFETGDGPFGMVVADFTGDGFPDVVTADDGFPGDARIAILKHNGQAGSGAGFLDYVEFQTGENSLRVDAADIDGDGDLDLAVGRGHFANSGNHGVSILFNDGVGNFSGLAQYGGLPGAYRDSPAVHLVDVDRDGDPDLIQGASENGNSVNTLIGVRLNDGNGVFGPPQVLTGPSGTFTPWYISSGDLNGDGWADILASIGDGRDDDGYLVFFSNGTGQLLQGVFYRGAKWTTDVHAEDVDGDGDQDVVTVANFSATITVHENEGDGDFFTPPVYRVTDILRDMKAADVDNDGDCDLVLAGFEILGNPAVYFLRNHGDGTFAPAEILIDGISVGYIEMVDLSGNSCLDMLLSPHSNTGFGFWVALNNCDGGFEPVTAYPAGGGQAAGVAAVDCNNDGAPDVVLPNSGSRNDVLIFSNNGNGTSFNLVNRFGDTIASPGVASADLDHDGNADLVVNTFGGAATFLGNGDFTFNGPLAGGQIISSYELGEFDGDGEFDLVGFVPGSFNFTGEFGVMNGYGDGLFDFVTRYPAATDFEYSMDELIAFDLNEDGFDDVVTSNGPSSDVSIFFNNGDGTLRHHDGHRYGVGYQASDAVIADFNGDGILDIACAVNYGDATVIFGTEPAGPDVVTADLFNLLRGSFVAGTLSDTFDSDDSYLIFNPGVILNSSEPPVWLEFVGTLPSNAPTTLSVTLEAQANTLGLTQTIDMFNWNSGQYEPVDSRAASFNTDSVATVDLSARISDYVQAGSGTVKTRMGWRATGPVLLYPWTVSIDQVIWSVQ